MKMKLIAMALIALTAAVVTYYPIAEGTINGSKPPKQLPIHAADQKRKIEVVFVLDTTGSMGGLIQNAKDKIWSIASNMASAQPKPILKIGLVAFRDRGDKYVTQKVDLSEDLDSVYAKLMDFQADGGGDSPESVNQALYEAVHDMSWSQDGESYRVIFVVGDAPAHMDYQDDIKFPDSIIAAKQKDIVVNTIQCGIDSDTNRQWKQIASLAGGQFFQVEQAGSAVVMTTPFDSKIAALSSQLDDTRLFYGNKKEKLRSSEKLAATKKLNAFASEESKARRGVFNASAAGADNFLGEKELVADVANGRIDLDSIPEDALPESLQPMQPAARAEAVASVAAKRDQLKKEINELAQQRQRFLEKEVDKLGGAEGSLDKQLFETIQQQAAAKGYRYDNKTAY